MSPRVASLRLNSLIVQYFSTIADPPEDVNRERGQKNPAP